MSNAETIMRSLNPNALIGWEDGMVVMIEDVSDEPGGRGRMYRMEVQSTPDGEHALAYCRYNPWGAVNGGTAYGEGHVDSDGFLCLGGGFHNREAELSPFDVATVIRRARFWVTAFSVLKETGRFPNP